MLFVWATWANAHGVGGDQVFAVALRGRPRETSDSVAPHLDADRCLAELHMIEDADARGECHAFVGAAELLDALPTEDWAVVSPTTSTASACDSRGPGSRSPRLS